MSTREYWLTRERATARKDKRMKNDKKTMNVKLVEIGMKCRIISSGKFGVLKKYEDCKVSLWILSGIFLKNVIIVNILMCCGYFRLQKVFVLIVISLEKEIKVNSGG